jgi:hypothetical protein
VAPLDAPLNAPRNAPLDAHAEKGNFRRRLFACLTILSLLLCLATVGLWVRSYWRYDGLTRTSAGLDALTFEMQSNLGEMGLFTFQSGHPSHPVTGWQYLAGSGARDFTLNNWPRRNLSGRSLSLLGFGYLDGLVIGNSIRAVYFPHWFLSLLLAILPAVHLRGILRTRRRNRAGLCANCGYDLRATPDRCPECGAVPPAVPGG